MTEQIGYYWLKENKFICKTCQEEENIEKNDLKSVDQKLIMKKADRFVKEIEVLGILLDQKGSARSSLDHRLAKAELAYGSIASLLKDPRVPIRERLRAWSRGPVNSALYGALHTCMMRAIIVDLYCIFSQLSHTCI